MLWWARRRIRSRDPGVRIRAAQELRAYAFGSAAPALFDAIADDESPKLREAVVGSLAAFGGQAIDGLVERLKNASAPRVRAVATVALGRIGDARATEGLLSALSDPSDEVHHLVVEALQQCGNQAVGRLREALIELVERHYPYYLTDREQLILKELRGIAPSDAAAVLASCLSKMRGTNLIPVIQQISELGELAVDALLPLVDDPDDSVRAEAVSVLGWLAVPRTLDRIVAVTRDVSPYVRTHAVKALAGFRDSRVTQALIDVVLADTEFYPQSIDQLQDSRKAAWLILSRTEWYPRNPLERAMRAAAQERYDDAASEGAAAVLPLLCILHSYDKYAFEGRKSQIVAALTKIGTAAVEPLLKMIAAVDLRTRIAAIEALGAIRNPGALLPLRSAVLPLRCTVEREDVRILAVQAIGQIGGEAAAQMLGEILNERSVADEPNLRRSTIEALHQVGGRTAATILVEYLPPADADCRVRICRALSDMAEGCAIGPLRSLLTDADFNVRLSAMQSLEKLGWMGWMERNAEVRNAEVQLRIAIDHEATERRRQELVDAFLGCVYRSDEMGIRSLLLKIEFLQTLASNAGTILVKELVELSTLPDFEDRMWRHDEGVEPNYREWTERTDNSRLRACAQMALLLLPGVRRGEPDG